MTKEKVLIWDIETLPALGYRFNLFEDTASMDFILKEPSVICIAYKWEGEKKTNVLSIADNPKQFKKDPYYDKEVLAKFMKIYEQADMTVAHFGSGFDKKFIQYRAMINKLGPVPEIKMIDTCLLSRQKFKSMSHKLDWLTKQLGLGRKMSTSAKLWVDVAQGDLKQAKYMADYNKQDVDILAKAYEMMKPYLKIGKAPTMGECPKCGKSELRKRGLFYTSSGTKQRLQCQSCGGWCSSTKDKVKEI